MRDDLPLIHCPPGPSDAELEAERDAKHQAAVDDWMRRNPDHDDEPDDHIPARKVTG